MVSERLVFGLRCARPGRMVFALMVFALAYGTAAAQQDRIVAVGDVHGDEEALVAVLQKAGMIDGHKHWSGGPATLIQLGDMLDRGLKDPEVLDLYMGLEQQAPQSGGRVVVLLGNHEVMNLMSDLRYVTNYSPFTDERSDERRTAAYQAYAVWRTRRAVALGKPTPALTQDAEDQWMEEHYRGYVERAEAFEPDGKYGDWLRSLPAVVQMGSWIFLHGGISPDLAKKYTLDQLNARIAEDIVRFDRDKQYMADQGIILPFLTLEEMIAAARDEKNLLEAKPDLTDAEKERLNVVREFLGHPDWLSWRPDGPLWFRGYETWTEEEGREHITALRKVYGPDTRFVVGHSPTTNKRIQPRFGDTVFMIDTGMSAMYYRGRPSALEIQYGGVTAVYRDARETLVEPAEKASSDGMPTEQAQSVRNPRIWWGADGQPLPFKTDGEVMAFMRTAAVVSIKDIGEGVTKPRKVLLEKDGIRMNTIFRDVSKVYRAGDIAVQEVRDDCIFECAAYELSRMLGLNNVPPVVPRNVKGTNGTMQIWVERAMTERVRREKKIAPFDMKRWEQDWQTVELFDNLIYNDDRNSGNIIIDQTFGVWMIDHTRAFRQYSDLRDTHTRYLKQVERRVWEKLRTLDDTTIIDGLSPYLQDYEIDGLLKRRSKLVRYIQSLIDKNGENAVIFTG